MIVREPRVPDEADATAGFRTLTIGVDPIAEGCSLAVGATPVGEMPSDLVPGRVLPLVRLDLPQEAP